MVTESAVKRGRETMASETSKEAQKKKSGNGVCKRWTPEQDEALKKAVAELGHRNWMAVAERVPGRDNAQCLQRWNKVLKPGLVKGPWSVEEDAMLMEMMLQGYDNWRQVSNNIPGRTAKQCRERWRNRLDPSIKKSPFTAQEDEAIQQAYEKYGNRWTQIAELLPGRTEDAVKLRWKALNPNQKTYTKLGRPRLLTTDDAPAISTSPVKKEAQRPVLSSVSVPSTEEEHDVTLEPILDPLEDERDERMSEEDVMILKAFLRGQSSTSSVSTLKNMFAEEELEDDIESEKRPATQRLSKMLSLGDTKSASLRSLTADVEPEDAWINGGLTRRLSSLSMTGENCVDVLEGNQKLSSLDSFEEQLAALNDAGSLLTLPLEDDKEEERQNEAPMSSLSSLQEFILEDELLETSTESDKKSTIPAHEFYSTTVPHDQLVAAQHFEI